MFLSLLAGKMADGKVGVRGEETQICRNDVAVSTVA